MMSHLIGEQTEAQINKSAIPGVWVLVSNGLKILRPRLSSPGQFKASPEATTNKG